MQATLGSFQRFSDTRHRPAQHASWRAWLVDLSARARHRFAAMRLEDARGLDAHMRRDVGLGDFHC